MSIKNVKVRFNLDKENDRKAYEYLQSAEVSYSKAVISAICGYMELSEAKTAEDAFLKGSLLRLKRKPQKSIPLEAYYNLCNSPLHKHPPKRKTTPKPKKQCSISSTASKGTLIPAFDGAVMAILKRIVSTNLIGSTIL